MSALADIVCSSSGMLVSEELEGLVFTSYLLPLPQHLTLNLVALGSAGYLLDFDFTYSVLPFGQPSLLLISPVLCLTKIPQNLWLVANTLPPFPVRYKCSPMSWAS